MRKGLIVAGVFVLGLLAVQSGMAKTPAKSGGTIVIVFRDGHRQTFNLSDIEKIEFPSVAAMTGEVGDTGSGSTSQGEPPRGRFIGKWEVGDGSGGTFYITLSENGSAHRTLHEADGKWQYVNGQALITWDDGAMDAIRKVGSRFEKSAYAMGKKFTDEPDNVTAARNTSPRPI